MIEICAFQKQTGELKDLREATVSCSSMAELESLVDLFRSALDRTEDARILGRKDGSVLASASLTAEDEDGEEPLTIKVLVLDQDADQRMELGCES